MATKLTRRNSLDVEVYDYIYLPWNVLSVAQLILPITNTNNINCLPVKNTNNSLYTMYHGFSISFNSPL